MLLGKMETLEGRADEEEDARSIEAENVGDEDQLDADLEREFLLQEEAKCKLQGQEEQSHGAVFRGSPEGGEGTLDVDSFWRFCGLTSLQLECAPSLVPAPGKKKERKRGRSNLNSEDVGGMQISESEECLSQGGGLGFSSGVEMDGMPRGLVKRRVVGNNLTLFPDMEQVTVVGQRDLACREQGLAKAVDDGGCLTFDERAEAFGRESFQVPFLKEGKESKWLRLGLPSNSYNSMASDRGLSSYLNRKLVSGSSSKVSVATSLERQYSTGSTSTVESPHFVAAQEERKRSNVEHVAARDAAVRSPGAPRLTFSFPGWGVDISKGEKHHPPVVSHHAEPSGAAAGDDNFCGRAAKRFRESPNLFRSAGLDRGKAVDENLGDRSPVSELPDEILLQVMRRLEIRDLCSSVQTCKRWHRIGLQNDLWEHLLGDSNCGEMSDSAGDGLPRWICKKNLLLSENVRIRFTVFCKGYDHLRRALHEWWNTGLQSSRYPSKGMYSLIRKLTANDWSLLYEALGVVFADRADRIANVLSKKLKPTTGCSTGEGASAEPIIDEKSECKVDSESQAPVYDNMKTSFCIAGTSSEYWKSGSVKDVSQAEGTVGKELCEALLKSWKRFKAWLLLISTHCPDLNSEVSLERGRSVYRIATPTLYEKGLICFRSQVVLRYGLRSVLQAGFVYLTAEDARDCTSEHDVHLLRSTHHLLQELDVPDDFTLPLKSHTQTKLRHCFRSALLTNSKLALHMNDRRNHL